MLEIIFTSVGIEGSAVNFTVLQFQCCYSEVKLFWLMNPVCSLCCVSEGFKIFTMPDSTVVSWWWPVCLFHHYKGTLVALWSLSWEYISLGTAFGFLASSFLLSELLLLNLGDKMQEPPGIWLPVIFNLVTYLGIFVPLHIKGNIYHKASNRIGLNCQDLNPGSHSLFNNALAQNEDTNAQFQSVIMEIEGVNI